MASIQPTQGFSFLKLPLIDKPFKSYPSLLDKKVTQVALRILTCVAIAAAIGLAAACAFSGALLPLPIIGVIVAVATVIISETLIRKGGRHFENPQERQSYQLESQNIIKACKHYKCAEIEKNPALKSLFKRPLTLIFDQFGASSVFKWQLLTPSQFKEAFLFEVNRLDIHEALAFYQNIKKTYNELALPATHPAFEIPAPADWGKSLKKELSQYHIWEFFREVSIQNLFDYELISEEQFETLSSIKTELGEVHKQFIDQEGSKDKLETVYKDFKYSLIKNYKKHYAHNLIHYDNQQFFKKVQDLQTKLDKRLEPILNNYQRHKETAKTWCQGNLRALTGDDLTLYNQFKKEFKDQKEEALKGFYVELGTLNEIFLREITDPLSSLQLHKDRLQTSFKEINEKALLRLNPDENNLDHLTSKKQRAYKARIHELQTQFNEVLDEIL